ncbi:uncharacterized protein [Rutidosis leptorrhynchoides]|uniref:uncharacterized protein n=1 Tax=Rutidosis leptorrhynchoides TaxID=125765 RepID=UPI003A9940EE
MKFPMPGRIATLYAERQKLIECSQVTKAIIKRIIHDDGSISPNPQFPDQKIIIGHTLSTACKEKLYNILATNLDVFAWQPSDMTGVPREVAEHRLNVNPNMHPICQKKLGATYQRLIVMAFKDQIGQNLEAYVDDIVIKSHTEEKMLRDMQETFASLRKINMKLNPKKCTFGVEEGNFLGHIVTEWGIKANPKKIQAIEDIKSPVSKKDVQRLHGCLAALTRFLSKAAEKSLPFMKVLKAPKEGETLILYLAVSKEAISSVLIAERNEYEALLSGLRIAVEMGITNLRAFVDSRIVAQQVNGTFDAMDTSMRQYNKKADVLSKLATLTFDHLHKRVLVEELKEKSIHEKPIMMIVNGVKETWMTPYLWYLHDGELPVDKTEARRIRVTTPMYEVINGVLYRKSYNGLLLRCLTNDEALKVVKEMHEGVCSQHSGFHTVASWIMRQGYFWPSLYREVAEIIKACENCQRHGTVQRLQKYDLIPGSSAWPFCKWVIDIVGPFNRSTVCRYGVPNEIVSDNGKQFVENPFRSTVRVKSNWLGGRTAKCVMGTPDNSKAEQGETPFSLVYGTEAVIPAEICVPTQRIMEFDIEANFEALRDNLNLLEERRLMAAIRLITCQMYEI